MEGVLEIDSYAFVALCRAIDDASDRGDTGEEIRLAAMPPPDLSRWLRDHGYPPLAGITDSELSAHWPGTRRGERPRHGPVAGICSDLEGGGSQGLDCHHDVRD
jgi:hypothetical protein